VAKEDKKRGELIMKKKHFYTIVILLLFLAVGIQPTLGVINIPGDTDYYTMVGTHTYILNQNVSDTIILSNPNVNLPGSGGESDRITFDGDGHTISAPINPSPNYYGISFNQVDTSKNGYITIQNLKITDCDVGINIQNATRINVIDTDILSCQTGISIAISGTCIVKDNNISGSSSSNKGIKFYEAVNNTIQNNTIKDNINGWGILITDTPNTAYYNEISNNKFINNKWHACVNNSATNANVFSYNYWDDYTGVDDGSNGRVAGDGIGDTDLPYTFTGGQDNYPWVVNDTDADGLSDSDEIYIYGTYPDNPDSDGDGLLDGTEVDMWAGSNCPNPLDPDSDDDTLLDGEEVLLGTDPCVADSDGDGIPDNIDPFPLDPEGTEGYIEEQLRADAEFILNIDLALFTGPNNNANKGRCGALSNRATAAANEVADANYQEAIDFLFSLLDRVDGVEPPKDWIVDSDAQDYLEAEMSVLIDLLGYFL